FGAIWRHFIALPADPRLIPSCSSGCCWLATATAFVPNGGCAEVHLNLAYRWFCRLGLDGEVPDHSTFSKNRHGRFRDCDLLRKLFETVLQRCIAEGLVGGEGFAVDASMIEADANRQRSLPGSGWLAPDAAGPAVDEHVR